jgi:hypothetical protein
MRSNAGRNASSRPYAIGSPHANVGEPPRSLLEPAESAAIDIADLLTTAHALSIDSGTLDAV